MNPQQPKSPSPFEPFDDVAFPYDVADDGTTATTAGRVGTAAAEDRHLRNLIEQLLFTAPGERVNRPEFGSGLLDLVFEPAGDALASSLQMGVQATLQQYLADRMEIEAVQVESEGSTLRIEVSYRALHDGRRKVETFEREV